MSVSPRNYEYGSHVGMALRVGRRQLLHLNSELQQLLFLFLLGERAKHEHVIRGGCDYAGFERQAQSGIEDYAQEWTTPRMAAAIGEQRIIGNHRANTHQNRVMLMTKLLHMGAS